MLRTELAQQIRAAAYLTGEFTLRSGLVSSFYWDKYRFESDPVSPAGGRRGAGGAATALPMIGSRAWS